MARYCMSNAGSISGGCQEIRAIQLHLHAKLFERKKKSFMNKRKKPFNLLWISASSDQLQLPLPSPSLSPSTSHNHSPPSHTHYRPSPPSHPPHSPHQHPPPPPTCNSHFTTKPPYSISVSFPRLRRSEAASLWDGREGGRGVVWDGMGWDMGRGQLVGIELVYAERVRVRGGVGCCMGGEG